MFSGMPTHESLKCSKKCPSLNFVMRVSSHFEWITAVRNFSSHSIYLPMTLFCAAKSKETKEVIERRSVTSRCHGEQNNNFALASRFFVHFSSVVTATGNILISRARSMEFVNTEHKFSFSFSKLGDGPFGFNPRKFCQHLTN